MLNKGDAPCAVPAKAARRTAFALTDLLRADDRVGGLLERMLYRNRCRHRERCRRIGESNREPIPLLFDERDQRGGNGIIRSIPPRAKAEHVQRRMALKQGSPQLDVSDRIEIAEHMQTHGEATWMVDFEEGHFPLKAPFKLWTRLHTFRPLHMIAEATPPMVAASRASGAFLKRERVGWKAAPFAFADFAADLLGVGRAFERHAARRPYRRGIERVATDEGAVIVGRHAGRLIVQRPGRPTAFGHPRDGHSQATFRFGSL